MLPQGSDKGWHRGNPVPAFFLEEARMRNVPTERFVILGGWTVELPNDMAFAKQVDGKPLHVWDNECNIYFSTFNAVTKSGLVIPVERMLQSTRDDLFSEVTRRERCAEPPVRLGVATIGAVEDYRSLSGQMVAPSRACVVTIDYRDVERDSWATNVWRSLLWDSSAEQSNSGLSLQ